MQGGEIIKHAAGDGRRTKILGHATPGVGDLLQNFRAADQPRKLSGECARGIRGAVVEPEPGHPRFDIIVEASQVGYDGSAAVGHGFEWCQRQRLAGRRQAWINEDGAAPIFADQGVLAENRTGELATDAVALRQRLQLSEIFGAVAALADRVRADDAQAPARRGGRLAMSAERGKPLNQKLNSLLPGDPADIQYDRLARLFAAWRKIWIGDRIGNDGELPLEATRPA